MYTFPELLCTLLANPNATWESSTCSAGRSLQITLGQRWRQGFEEERKLTWRQENGDNSVK